MRSFLKINGPDFNGPAGEKQTLGFFLGPRINLARPTGLRLVKNFPDRLSGKIHPPGPRLQGEGRLGPGAARKSSFCLGKVV
ncbi:MAG: hypothetical protein LBR11_02700 [Deltaproteobacteria bacterium]|nr:hypothetical protein [Deltaproteobacteria bacterium]